MPILPYSFLRPWLFRMEPEAAHEFTLRQLERIQHTPLMALAGQARVDDQLTLAGLHFPNRVGLAAGMDKNARCIDAWGALGFGFVEVGTVTPKGQAGNPKPRLFRLPRKQALINRLGFNNDGLEAFISNVQRSRLRRQAQAGAMLLGLNIGKNAATPIEQATDDYLACLEGVYPHADYIAVNISSPNTQNLRTLQSDAALEQLLGALTDKRAELADRFGQRKPLFLKIAPDLDSDQLQALAAALQRHQMDGVIATNTTVARQGVQGLAHAQEAGGLSGAPLLQASNDIIRQLRTQLGKNFPIIGVGGILSGADAVSKIQAGADVVQIYTGLIYRGPGLVTQASRALLTTRV